MQHASGKKFQDVLEEAFVRPLNVEGEFYIGIPSGVESRLATLTIDRDDLSTLDPKANPLSTILPSSLTLTAISNLIALLNTLDGRCAIVPGANGHFSARALARYYAALVDGGMVPPRHPSSSLPPLGIHPHHPINGKDKNKDNQTDEVETLTTVFANPKVKIHDAFMGTGDYKSLTFPNGPLGLGFYRLLTTDGSLTGFGHAGVGGSTAYCDINN
ncbi:hypothetical protein M8C21_019266, partial [Ambrosia artemisiifolia]